MAKQGHRKQEVLGSRSSGYRLLAPLRKAAGPNVYSCQMSDNQNWNTEPGGGIPLT